MKLPRSLWVIAIALIILILISSINSYQIYTNNQQLQNQRNQDLLNLNSAVNDTRNNMQIMQDLLNGEIDNLTARLPISQYEIVIYRVWDYISNVSDYLAKNGKTGIVEWSSTDAAFVFNQALANYNSVYVTASEYNITSDIVMANKKNARLDSYGAVLNMFSCKLAVVGSSYQYSQYDQISGFIIVNGTLRIENSFRTTVIEMIFQNSTLGIELVNSNSWTEATRLDTIHFDKCTQGLVFRTNTTTANNTSTGSYANTEVNRCYFNQLDNSSAITVEKNAEFTDSQLDDVRIWIGEFGGFNQTGLQLNGSMYKTLMNGVVFESFVSQNYSLIYAVQIGADAYQTGNFANGVNFLGYWTARISNPSNKWIFGSGAVFKLAGITVPVGVGDYGATQIIQIQPATIATFKPKITVQGSFSNNETVTVRFRLEYLDNSNSPELLKTFTNSSSIWLSDDDLMQLYGRLDVIYCILVDAKVPVSSTARVTVDLYGSTT